MPTVTEQTLTVHDLYAMRDRIGLSYSECEPPIRRELLRSSSATQDEFRSPSFNLTMSQR
jgi:hypothetical protein